MTSVPWSNGCKRSTLPVVDIAPFLSQSSSLDARHDCATALNTACRDVGFFYLVGHGLTQSTVDRAVALARQFFLETSDVDKQTIARRNPGVGDGDGARGYQKVGENVTGGKQDHHEAIDLYAEHRSASTGPYQLLHGRNLWPTHPVDLQPAFLDYIESVKGIGTAVVRAMASALALDDEDTFVRHTRESFWVMRIIGYPGLSPSNQPSSGFDPAEQFSCGAHTDYGCLTLLASDVTRGALQVQSKQGHWIPADPMDGAFVVNIGDMMERWTNGLWKSTPHRVIHRGEGYRVSIPFFFEPNWDAEVRPLRECVARSGGEPLYDSVKSGEHLTAKVATNFHE